MDGIARPEDPLLTDVQYLKGVGPSLAMKFRKLGLATVRDMLEYYPRRYEDRSQLPPLMTVRPGQSCSVRGRIKKLDSRPTRGGKVLIKAVLADDTGEIDLIWFNQPWVAKELKKVEGDVVAFGMVKEGEGWRLQMTAPEWESLDEDDDAGEFARVTPVYGLTEGVGQWMIRRAAAAAVDYFSGQARDPFPDDFRRQHRLQRLSWCYRHMHQPENLATQATARRRLAFEEFLYLQLGLQMRRAEVQQELGISFPISQIHGDTGLGGTLFGAEDGAAEGGLWDQVHRMLPFDLTGAQRRVIGEIWRDMERPHPMNRLVQGDVGSGKTAVAACAMLAAVRCGYQAALMAPTEILAEQHALNLKRLFAPLGIEVALMVGKLGAKAKRRALEQAASGEAPICVGTHALISEGVSFHKLGFAVIDEQHRFGVVQRLALRQKGTNPDVLVMTATPIPRTLTMSLYGDLDLSVIDELPPGRKPIKTHWRKPDQRNKVYQIVRDLVKEGRQAYFVCPMITESDKMQTQAAEDLHYRLSTHEYPDLRVGLLHGQMKGPEKEEVMTKFRGHELDILVSTVVIEVGVDVPNATVMVIEDANRFGLAQLHQLRGRVGRGGHQSFCILIASATNPESEQRLRIMEETTDGFRIAEEDLKIRGPGDVAGTRQSGQLTFKLANLIDDGPLLEETRMAAMEILRADPTLAWPDHALLLERLREQRSHEALIVVS